MRTKLGAVGLASVVVGGLFVVGATAQLSPSRQAAMQASLASASVFIDAGDPALALKYYQRIQGPLQFPLLDAAGNPVATLDGLIAHFGYEGIGAADLEKIESAALMPADEAGFDALAARVSDRAKFTANLSLAALESDNILVSRFFAPKIVDYTGAPPFVPGWRKLVRLEARANSGADKAGLADAYILFNYVRGDVSVDPFEGNVSKNNQVIIVPKSAITNGDAVYFMVFLQGPSYNLGLALEGVAFDLPARMSDKYYVPIACAQCHGHDDRAGNGGPRPGDGIYRVGRLNYLDTDQWHDALEADFPQLTNAPHGVVFDGGKDPAAPRYKAAMSVFRKLNQAARDQAATIDGSDFKIKAAEKWLDVHASNDAPVPIDKRILDLGGKVWDLNDPEQKELLMKFDRYCFRCHSSVRYNVFDKQGTSDSSPGMPTRMTLDPSNPRYMPNGRVIDPAERDRMIALIEKLL